MKNVEKIWSNSVNKKMLKVKNVEAHRKATTCKAVSALRPCQLCRTNTGTLQFDFPYLDDS
jgi:hypothetical protein